MAFASVQVVLINFWHSTYSYVSLPFTVLLSLSQWLIFLPLLVTALRCKGPAWMILAPSVMVLFDWLRGMGFLAYPWGMLGTVVYPWPVFIQLASVTGIWGLTWLLTACNAAISHMIIYPEGRRRAFELFAVSLLLPLVFGAVRLGLSGHPPEDKRLLLIQHNMDPRKYDYAESLELLMGITEHGLEVSAGAEKPVDLIVWPEDSFCSGHPFLDAGGKLRTAPAETCGKALCSCGKLGSPSSDGQFRPYPAARRGRCGLPENKL